MDVDVECKLSPLVSVGDAFEDLPHIGGAGERHEPTLAVERLVQLGFGNGCVTLQVKQRARVDGARPRRHDEAFERGEPHRRVHRATPMHRGQ